MNIARELSKLIAYSLENELINPQDVYYATNALLDVLGLDAPPTSDGQASISRIPISPTPMLETLSAYGVQMGLCEDTLDEKDRFCARLMGCLVARPSEIIRQFHEIQSNDGAKAATDWFYALGCASDYIKTERIAKNERFFAPSPWGQLEITINLSKPEKDPIEVAKLKELKSVGYPACMLCNNNVGYAGRIDYPARQNLRTVPLHLSDSLWHLQFSPYAYYNEHCIILSDTHQDMKVSKETFVHLLDFIYQFPHYFIGSNADLPIVGGSILNHDHFQAGNHTMPMDNASDRMHFSSKKYPEVSVSVLNWPVTTLRLRGKNRTDLIDLGGEILAAWRAYTDESAGIYAYTDAPHNTITPIARYKNGQYEIDLALRNNRTTAEHPLGMYHAHADLHHIKKENIGLIEVMGLFILPGRLQEQLELVAKSLTTDAYLPYSTDDPMAIHEPWIQSLREEHGTDLSLDQAQRIIKESLAQKCARVLVDVGVFPQGTGDSALIHFLSALALVRTDDGKS